MRPGRVWMWIRGAATVVGLVVIALSLGDSGEVSGRTVLYTVVALLAWGRGFFTYREGLATSQGRVRKRVTPEEEAAATRRVIVWTIVIAAVVVGLSVFVASFTG